MLTREGESAVTGRRMFDRLDAHQEPVSERDPIESLQADRTDGERPALETEESALLPGECDDTNFRDDAQHWVTVYEEMVSHARDLVSAGDGLESALTESLARYRQRLEFWQRRLRELTP